MLSLRPATLEDETFLYDLFATAREEEFAMLPEDQRKMLLRMQFEAQKRSYRTTYSHLQQWIVLLEDSCIGQLTQAVEQGHIVLVDVALVPSCRNQGYGTQLLLDLQQSATEQMRSVQLHVLAHSPALRLYERLGFRVRAERIPYVAMAWEVESQSGNQAD